MKKLFLTLVVTTSMVGFAETKIGFVDLERVVNEVKEGAQVNAELKGEFSKRQAELDRRQDEVKKLKEQYDAGSALMKAEVRQQKEAELQRKFGEVQQQYVGSQQDMQRLQQEKMSGMLQKIQTISHGMGQKGEYDMILNRNLAAGPIVLYAKPSMDLTNEMIRKYNEAYPVTAKTAPAAKKPAKK